MYSVVPLWRLSNPFIYHIIFYVFSKGWLDFPLPSFLLKSLQLNIIVLILIQI